MPRKNRNARKEPRPKPLKTKYRGKIVIIEHPQNDIDDIRPGRVVMAAEYRREWAE